MKESKKSMVSNDIIKLAHKEGSPLLKKDIELEHPNLFNVEDGWYINEKFPLLAHYQKDGKLQYGVDTKGDFFTEGEVGRSTIDINMSLATASEIEPILREAGRNKGYTSETKLKDSGLNINDPFLNDGVYNDAYYLMLDTLWNKNGKIYEQGVWADKIKEEHSLEDVFGKIDNDENEIYGIDAAYMAELSRRTAKYMPMPSLNPEKNTEDFNIKDLKLLMDVYDAVSDSEEIYCGLPALEDIRCLMAKVSQRIIL